MDVSSKTVVLINVVAAVGLVSLLLARFSGIS
ncbi:stress response membrane protein YncL [Pseudocitrobacter cyperus]|uniref:Stress response membrane protein YncL n=1 Tax=Pseudocitrobacter cyperus TaxID=3112843 RepID=A0ABV0HGF7_9ENTR